MKKPSRSQIRRATNALNEVARNHGITLDEVRKEIDDAIAEARSCPDPIVQAKWKEIPCAGEVPTAEEVMVYVLEKMGQTRWQ